ncbi:hypothetical protein E2F50_09010 [Rhizobium deserti]|uniref:Uncharacterized protein n=1 Tax=Rhizobium deserti TaxID=2547961 RepID=A0A4R5UJI5_9HYPH|nr:hypothetical protein [Rhizobium deserti]TDK37032.1 hypothetical protein E2F50_09010 [Rhizobium deserti]
MKNQSKHTEALMELIAGLIATNPHQRGGFTWAMIAQPEVCKKLNISLATLRRIISQPPFRRQQARIDGTNYSLLRVAVPGEVVATKTPEHVGNIMKKIWREWLSYRLAMIIAQRDELTANDDKLNGIEKEVKQLKRLLHHKELNHAWGCFRNLAELWPEGHQVEIFKLVLRDWQSFMAGVKVEIWTRGNGVEKFFTFPSISVLREFYKPALELYVMEQQSKANNLSPELRQLSECIYVH